MFTATRMSARNLTTTADKTSKRYEEYERLVDTLKQQNDIGESCLTYEDSYRLEHHYGDVLYVYEDEVGRIGFFFFRSVVI